MDGIDVSAPLSASRQARGQSAGRSFRQAIDTVRGHAIFLLDDQERVATWNEGAEQVKGWAAEDIIGCHLSTLYPAEDVAAGTPSAELAAAAATGSHVVEGWRMRQDGSRFWACTSITPLVDDGGSVTGFTRVTEDATARLWSQTRLEAAASVAHLIDGDDGDVHAALLAVAQRTRSRMHAALCWVAVQQPESGDDLVIRIADGEGAERVLGQRCPRPAGPGKESQEHPTPGTVPGDDIGSTHVVALPTPGRAAALGIVWRGIGLPSSEQLALGSPYAAQATALLEYERSRRELSVLALATEHERIGAELQNTVIHDLFAIGLALNGIGPAVSQPGAHRALDSAVDDLDAVIRLIRTTIFQLRTSTGGG